MFDFVSRPYKIILVTKGILSLEHQEFNHNGFFVAKDLLDKQTVIDTLHSITQTFNAQLTNFGKTTEATDILPVMCELYKHDIECYKKTVAALWRKLDVYQLMHDRRVIEFLRNKFGWQDVFVPGGQVVHIMAHELKIPGGYFGLVPHQDFASVQGSLDGITIWVPLVNVDQDNFPLEIVPGSHKLGLLNTIESGDSQVELQYNPYVQSDYVPVEVNIGDVVFMSMFTVHQSSVSGKLGRCRVALSTRFDNANEKTFINRVYPTAYQRKVHRSLLTPGLPTLSQLQDIFNF